MNAGHRADDRNGVDLTATRRQFLVAREVLAEASADHYRAARKMRAWPTSQRDLVIASLVRCPHRDAGRRATTLSPRSP